MTPGCGLVHASEEIHRKRASWSLLLGTLKSKKLVAEAMVARLRRLRLGFE